MRTTVGHTPKSAKAWAFAVAAVLVLLLALIPFVFTRALWPRWIAIMTLAWWLPGVLLVAHWRLPDLDLPTAGMLALGLGLCWMVLVGLVINWLPGPIGLWLLVATYAIGALLLLVALYWHRPLPLQPTPTTTWVWIIALLALAVALRLPGIGYHEFHVDEVFLLRRARMAIEGTSAALQWHTKGPAEIIIATILYRALGTVTEATARLPFGLMSVGSVLATALLGRRLFSPAVGFWAGVLLVANGFALGLSRILQYQPTVLLLSPLAVLAAWEFAQSSRMRWLVLTATFSAFGLVMHYEFGLLLPALLVLVWVGWQRASERRSATLGALASALVGVVIVAIAYVPILLDPYLAKTQSYLSNRVGGLGTFNLAFFVEMGTFYNSIYFFVGLIFLVLAGLVWGWLTARRRTLLLVLWFLPFFVLFLFVMRFPGTHFYQMMESWSLLAALPLAALTQSKRVRPVVRWGALALIVVWLVVSAGYLYLTFFRQSPEYVVNYEEARVPFYWTPYGKNIPEKPRFGFPIHEGWGTLGTLAEWGCLEGTFTSNERSHSLRWWYVAPLRRVEFEAAPDYVFVADHVQEADPMFEEDRLLGYQQVGEVRVRDEPRIELWARQPLPVPYVTYHAEDFAMFDEVVPTLTDWPDPPTRVHDVTLGEAMVLESAGLTDRTWSAGDMLHLLLVLRPQQTLATDYKLFVHLADEGGRPVAQWDGYPCFNTARTSQWPVGEAVRDHVLLRIPSDIPRGEYSLLVGFYDESTGERLGGQAILVAEITIP